MSLNIIIRNQNPVDWKKVTQLRQDKENAQRDWYNREGYKQIGKRQERVAQLLDGPGTRNHGLMLSVPVWLDGKLMDVCREANGHTEWRRDKKFISWLAKQEDMSWMKKYFGKGLDRMIAEADDSMLTPAYQRETAQQDLAKLPAHYRQGVK